MLKFSIDLQFLHEYDSIVVLNSHGPYLFYVCYITAARQFPRYVKAIIKVFKLSLLLLLVSRIIRITYANWKQKLIDYDSEPLVRGVPHTP